MKKNFRLLSILSAVVVGATMSLTACGSSSVEEHDHEWNDGEITTPSTCYSEGVKTYTCTFDGCGQTKIEPVAMTEHNWDSGEVTTEPTCSTEGVKTFHCANEGCNKTKEEPVDKTEHSWDAGEISKVPDFLTKGAIKYSCLNCDEEKSQSLPAHADFAEQYSAIAEQSNWVYGYASHYDWAAGEIELDVIQQADAESGTWKAEGVEIGQGYVYSQNNAIIAYSFSAALPVATQAEVEISFKGEESATVLTAHLVILDENGDLIDGFNLNTEKTKDWSFATSNAVDVAQGYSVWLIFENVGTGKASGALTFTITAHCVHVWNSGAVTKAATCTEEGVKQYTCLSCEKTYTETIEKTAHEYEGVVTTEPTDNHAGVMTYTCKHCQDTYTEEIPKLGSSVFNGANFAEDFELTTTGEFNGWSVGVVDYIWSDENFNFTKITTLNGAGDAYNDNTNGWKEIKGDWMAVNGMMGFAYHFEGTASTTFTLVINGADNSNFSVRWALKDKDGNIKTNDGKASWGGVGKDVTVTEDITAEVDDILYILVNKDGDNDQCTFSLVLTGEGQTEQPATPFEGANFAEDFELNESGEFNGWTVGVVDYIWSDENFNFTKISALNGNGDCYHSDNPWMDIKGDWMAVNGMMGFAYHFEGTASTTFNFILNGADNSNFSVRWALKDKDGNIKTNDGKASWGGAGKDVAVTEDITAEVGDVFYILVNKDGDNDQCWFTLELIGEDAKQPATPFEGANFAEDFELNESGEFNGWSIGVVDYIWSEENFNFTKITALNGNGDCYHSDSPWMDIKGDWMAVNGMMAIAYNFQGAASVNFDFVLNGAEGGNFSIRWALKDKDGNIKTNGGKASWGGAGKDVTVVENITVEEGDVLYILVNKEGDSATDQCNFSVILTDKQTNA